MQVTSSILKCQNTFGSSPSSLAESVDEPLGLAFGMALVSLGERMASVGHDGCLTDPALTTVQICGLTTAGMDLIDIALVTPPNAFFAASILCNSGIRVTGSHIQKSYSGRELLMVKPDPLVGMVAHCS